VPINVIILNTFILLCLGVPGVSPYAADAELLPDEDIRPILLDAVETAYRYDLFNIHCRGFPGSNKLNDVDKLLAANFGLTTSDVITQYAKMDEQTYLHNLEKAFYDSIAGYGGCRAAKRHGMLEVIQTHYTGLLQMLQQIP